MTLTTAPAAHDTARTTFRKLMLSRPDEEPFPLYADLRHLAPVLQGPLPIAREACVLSRYAECSAALRHRGLVPCGPERIGSFQPDWQERTAARLMYNSLVFQHRQPHAEVRRCINGHFTLSQVNGLRDFVVRSAQQRVDDLAQHPSGQVVDLVEELTLPFPLAVISRLFGLELADTKALAWAGRILPGVLEPLQSRTQVHRIERAARDLVEFFQEPVRRRRAEDTGDLISALVHAGHDEDSLFGNLLFLFSAGYDSSTSLLGTAITALLHHPEQADLLRTGAVSEADAVQELLRFDPPVHATSRVTAEPVRLGGEDLPEDTLVWILLGSANRDPEVAEEPDRLDLTRKPAPNLAFAAGPHSCVGARLARMEAEVMLPMLLRRFPRMRLAATPRNRYPGTVLRGVDRLPVVLDGGKSQE